ncbi:transposase [Modicisalibacter tunisiensis]|uniref:IS110 family transposase n=1 Tax=Modicisalibacter TaxID=574347 RepID=UPI0013D7792A|nr:MULTISPECIES: transposase [Modicisalibacter]MBZ9537606.1 transposase [Modicisalibacter tunisiensis]MBZ9537933.1 transposase [Modicisalibacter tunisiensis]MBZ9538978.1 transposase [Modicisalibacter tunisiensis]MBZ9539820.1 transposase [Modicisalibacter tunisiensis]MBZ9540381.1 transposase [Modicisalibacter tunisiensis]
MTIQTVIGIDVAKHDLVVYRQDLEAQETLENRKPVLKQWLRGLPPHCAIAVEATGTYHVALIELAYQLGHEIYVVDGFQLHHYRQGVGGRAKTDSSDARLLARYLDRERELLRAWTPPPAAYRSLQTLLRRRATLVQARVAIQQSCAELPWLASHLKRLVAQLTRLDELIQTRLRSIVREAGLRHQVARCKAMEGVGELTATALVMAFLRGDFRHSDAFVAFLGLDVRVRDSGKQRGRRKLTKRGDPEVRRLLHNAAMAARRQPGWKETFERYQARGLKSTQVLVILARKLARIAFSLMKHETGYRPPSPIKA